MTSVNLDKLNTMFRKIVHANMALSEINTLLTQLGNELNFNLYSNYSDIPLDDVKEAITQFILTKYQQAVCPNVDLFFLCKDIREKFHNNLQYNCYNIVDFINERIGDSTERLAYRQLLEGAKFAIAGCDGTDLATFISEHTQKNREIILTGCGARRNEFTGYDTLAVFEKFVNLILLNAGLFHRTPPSQMQFTDFSDFIRSRRPGLPFTIQNPAPHARRTIKRMAFYKRGRVDVEFYSTGDFLEVSKAICGEEPKIYFPKSSAKPEDIFDARPDGRIKRVVKMEGACGISEENK